MAKVTEKAIKAAVLQANQNSKHLLIGLQMDKGAHGYAVNAVARKTGAVVQSFTDLTASEAHEAITMFDLCARVTALQINGLAGALEALVNYVDTAEHVEDSEEFTVPAHEALTKFRGSK